MRVGLVGTAFGESRAPMISAVPGVELACLCGRDPERTRAIAERLGTDHETDWRKLVARPDIDVVGVYTGTDRHYDMALGALEAGKHAIVSKPLSVRTSEAEQLLAAARSAGRRLVVEFDTRYQPGPYAVFRALAEGGLGRPIQGEYANKCLRPQSYYEEGSGWRGDPARGGGCLLNQGAHAIDHMTWYQGEVESVFAFTGTFDHAIEGEDAASAVIRFRNGSLATLTVTTTFASGIEAGRYGGAGTLKRAQVHGTLGSATVEGTHTHTIVGGTAASRSLPERPPLNVFADLKATLDFPDTPSRTLVEGDAVLEAVRITDALRRSAAEGRPIPIARPN